MREPTFHIEGLTPHNLSLLAQLLSLHPSHSITTSWLNDQSELVSRLPSSLLRPKSLVLRLASSLPFAPRKAHLCPTHKPLNPLLIRRVFLDVSAECTMHLDRLVRHSYLPKGVEDCVKRLQVVNSLWTSRELYRAVFRPKPEDERFDCVVGGCEACILACIGGNQGILSDLRASMLGRKKRGRPQPVLLEMVEAWIDWKGSGEDIRGKSKGLGKEIRRYRMGMQKIRRRARSSVKNRVKDPFQDSSQVLDHAGHGAETDTLVDVDDRKKEEMDDEQRAEREESIIDFYAELVSNADQLSRTTTIEGLHEAFRESIIFDAESGTFRRINREGEASRAREAYTESTYSTDMESGRARSSEQYARSYQNLLGIEDDEEPRGRTTRRETRSESRMTRWSDFK